MITIRKLRDAQQNINRTLYDELCKPLMLHAISEIELTISDDDHVRDTALGRYDRVREIKNERDRELVLEMLLSDQVDYLAGYGKGWLDYFIKNNEEVYYVFDGSEIVGHFRTQRQSRFSVDIVIGYRGKERVRARAAMEMIHYWEKTFMETLYKQNYKAVTVFTLTEKHARVLHKIREREYNKIRTETLEKHADMPKQQLQKLIREGLAGFNYTGTRLLRPFNGEIVKEHIYRYDLSRHFEEVADG